VFSSSPNVPPEDMTAAFDGKTSTKWFAGNGVATAWIRIRFRCGCHPRRELVQDHLRQRLPRKRPFRVAVPGLERRDDLDDARQPIGPKFCEPAPNEQLRCTASVRIDAID